MSGFGTLTKKPTFLYSDHLFVKAFTKGTYAYLFTLYKCPVRQCNQMLWRMPRPRVSSKRFVRRSVKYTKTPLVI